MAKLLSLFMAIFYMLSTVGLFPNNPVTINVSDENGNAVSGVTVYYQEQKLFGEEIMAYLPIAETDENGNVVWENHYFGDCKIYIADADDETMSDWEVYTVNVPLTGSETISIKY